MTSDGAWRMLPDVRTPLDDEIEATQRATWDRFSTGWERWDDIVQQMLGPVGEAMIRSLGIRADQNHLDVAAGTGQPGQTIAQLAPRGRVMLADLSPEMLAAARRIAESNGIDNIDTRECSADQLPFPDATFDSATCRFGLMFVPHPSRAVAELSRVARPGGRIAVAVWAGPDKNPWATIPGSAIAAEAVLQPPAPDAPGIFRCATPGAIVGLYQAAGLREINEWDVPVTMAIDSPDEYWRMINELTASVVTALDRLNEAARERIATNVMREVRKFQCTGVLRVPGTARCIVGTR
jgi:SAM-dependent methyltransferase